MFGNKYQESVKNHVRFDVENAKGTESYKLSAVGFNLWEKYCFVKENSVDDATFDLIFTKNLIRKLNLEILSIVIFD